MINYSFETDFPFVELSLFSQLDMNIELIVTIELKVLRSWEDHSMKEYWWLSQFRVHHETDRKYDSSEQRSSNSVTTTKQIKNMTLANKGVLTAWPPRNRSKISKLIQKTCLVLWRGIFAKRRGGCMSWRILLVLLPKSLERLRIVPETQEFWRWPVPQRT